MEGELFIKLLGPCVANMPCHYRIFETGGRDQLLWLLSIPLQGPSCLNILYSDGLFLSVYRDELLVVTLHWAVESLCKEWFVKGKCSVSELRVGGNWCKTFKVFYQHDRQESAACSPRPFNIDAISLQYISTLFQDKNAIELTGFFFGRMGGGGVHHS